jgi:hypothetical protein
MSDSEFGKGLTYCLGLFLAHAERFRDQAYMSALGKDRMEMWFNAASDHLYDLQIPETLTPELSSRLIEFQSKCLRWGHGFDLTDAEKATEADMDWSLKEAKELLLEIDKHFGIPVEEATWA